MHTQSFLFLALLAVSWGQVVIQDLTVNTAAHGVAHLEQWNFYKFIVLGNNGFVLKASHASKHDLDIYISKAGGSLPGPKHYLYKDTNSNPNITIEGGAEPEDTTYVAGIYGFHGLIVPFSIQFTYSNGCPASCSDRGSCVQGVCRCRDGFAGGKCEYTVSKIISQRHYGPFTESSEDWMYFSLPMYTQESLKLLVTLKSGLVDVYVKHQQIPTLTSYTMVGQISHLGVTTVNITDLQLGTWYFGFFGLADGTNFEFELDKLQLCPNECSGPHHGNCIGSTCRCMKDYYTSDCGTYRKEISFGTPYYGVVISNSWNFFSVNANTANSVIIHVTGDSNSRCDVYVRDRNWPSLTNFTFHNTTQMNGESYTVITQPGFVDWRIGIYGSKRCTYTMTATLQNRNDCGCSEHGTCAGGSCVCQPGWTGERCERELLVLQNNVTQNSSVGKEEWHYYTFNAINCTQMVFIMKEISTTGFVWMFFSVGQRPTLQSYLVKEDNPTHQYHRISIIFAYPPTDVFPVNVAIYGSPYINQKQVSYKLEGFQTPF